MKVIKHLFGFVLFLVLLLGLLAGGLCALIYDGSKAPDDLVYEVVDMEGECSDDFKASLVNITSSNYEDNNIKLDFSINQLNGMLAKLIREKLNPQFQLEGGDKHVYKTKQFSVDSAYLMENEGALKLKAHFTALGFLKTSLAVQADIKVKDTNLVIAFNEVSIGERFSKGFAIKVFQQIIDAMNIDLGGKEGFNASTMSMEIPIRDIFPQSMVENKMLGMLLGCSFTAGVTDFGLSLSINTAPLFNKGVTLPLSSEIDINDKLTNGKLEGTLIGFSVSEAEVNKLIEGAIADKLFNEAITLGNNVFNVRLDGLYYNIKESKLISNLFLDDVKTSITIDVTAGVVEKDGLKSISIRPVSAVLGTLPLADVAGLVPEIVIDEALLGLDSKTSIKDLVIDRENGKLDFKVQANI